MNIKTINDVEVSLIENNQIVKLSHGDVVVDLSEVTAVNFTLEGGHIKLKNTYNEAQALSISVAPTYLQAIAQYIKDPITSYRTVVQSNNSERLTAIRNRFSSFVMYGSQGLDSETTERLSFAYRVIGSLFDESIIDRVAANEHQELPKLAAKDQMRILISRLLELHFGYVVMPSEPVELMDAPITSIISGRAPDELVNWALNAGLITDEQATHAMSV